MTATSTPEQPVFIPAPQPDTVWGEVSVLAESPAFHPPALTSSADGFIAAAFMRFGGRWRLMLYVDDLSITTGVFADNPYALTLHAASDGGLFAVWLDYSGGQGGWLYAARLDTLGESELGAIRITEAQVVRYSATPNATGLLWLTWSAAPIPESLVMVSRIDRLGRPRTPAVLLNNADYPALVRADGRIWLYWLTADTNALHRAELTEGQTLEATTRLNDGLAEVVSGAVLTGLSVGVDETTTYVFLQVMREMQPEVWWVAGDASGEWVAPRRLSVTFDATQPTPQAGFNHGTLTAAYLGDARPILWANPAVGQTNTLAISAVWEGGLGVIYVRNGVIFAAQELTVSPRLIAPPTLAFDRQRDLALGWWVVVSDTTANLMLIYSRR